MMASALMVDAMATRQSFLALLIGSSVLIFGGDGEGILCRSFEALAKTPTGSYLNIGEMAR
jgi:hypothetical protein